VAKFVKITTTIEKKHLVLVKSIIEGEDDVGIVRTVTNTPDTSTIEVLTTSDMAQEVYRILDELSHKIMVRDTAQVQ
jgi:hypothetical protein